MVPGNQSTTLSHPQAKDSITEYPLSTFLLPAANTNLLYIDPPINRDT
jgi:hypothetical protein